MTDYEIKKQRTIKRLNNFFKGKEIKCLQSEELKEFVVATFKTINRSAYYNSVRVLNDILEENGSKVVIDSKELVDECTMVRDEQYFTLKEIRDVCNTLMNFQDKLIVYMLFNGIMGKSYKDILQMKVDQISEDYTYININGQKFMCDQYMQYLLRGCVKQRTYVKFVRNSEDMLSPDTFDFNMSSPYLIKVKPSKRNSDGLNPMGSSALQRKLTKLQDIFAEYNQGEKLILSGLSLVKSGIMYQMFMQEVENPNKIWTIDEVDKYLKMKGYRINPNELYRVYWWRYHDSKVAY